MNREKAAIVEKYCNENTKPKQDLCPVINQYIRTSKGYEIWNSKSLKRESISFDPTRWQSQRDSGIMNIICVRNEYEGLYVEYHEDMDALEFAHIFMDGGRGKADEAKEWTYGVSWNISRYFIFRNDPNAYSFNGIINTGNAYYAKELLKEMKSWARRSLVGTENYEEFKKFVPDSSEIREYNHWYTTPLAQIWQYAQWYQMEFIKRSKSKTLTDIECYELKDITPHRLSGDNERQAYFYILDDKYAVLRIYKFPSSWEKRYGGNKNNGKEVARLFISAKGKPTLMSKEYGGWKIKSSTPWEANGYLLFINESEMNKWKPLKYIIPCLDLHKTGIDELVSVLRHPIVEQLSKAGYPNIAKKLQNDRQVAQDLKNYFLVEKEKKMPMFKLLGVNKFALNAAEKYQGNLTIIREIKFFMGGFDATEASEEVCNYIADYIGLGNGYWSKSITDIIPGYVRGYSYRRNSKYATPITDEQRKWVLKMFRLESKQAGCIELFDDVVKTYNRLRERPDVDIYNVKSYDDIQRLHDALIELKIQQDREDQALRDASERERQEMLQKKFEKLQKDRIEKFEYEDDDFCIRVPHELNEITREGIYLHHCVGGYLDRHAQGGTNILFLRRKADENTPFYTIEINNNDTVVQIHGSHNKWLGNDPDAVPFVYKYLNKIGAGFDRKILLNKGAGYSASSDNLPESYLEAV